jgi:hypothetical protein
MRRVITREVDVAGSILREHQTTTVFVSPSRYGGPWSGMMMFSQEGWAELDARLADRSIGMQAVRVLVAMLRSVEVHDNNRVRMGRKDLARELGMYPANVSAAIRQLVDCGFVEAPQYKFGYYTISPCFAWYGKTDALRDALRARGRLDDKGMMTAA